MENNTLELMGMLTGIIITLGFFAAIILSIYFLVKTRNKERMAIIEKGGDLSELYKKKRNGHGFFKTGMVVIGVAIGLILGGILDNAMVLPEGLSYFAMILLGGGSAIILANYLIANNKVGKA
jgi:hypothetical protein